MKRALRILTAILMAALIGGCAGGGAANKLEKIQDAGVLTVGTSPDYAPYEFIVAGEGGQMEYVGVDMEIAQEIAADIGVELKIVPLDFTALESALETGEIDLILAAYSATESRAVNIDFSDVYYTDEVCVFASAESANQYASVNDFAGKTVGVQLGTTMENDYFPQLANAEKVACKTVSELVEQMKAGVVDAIIVDKPIAEAYVAKDGSLAITQVAFPDAQTTSYVACVAKDEPALLAAVNATIGKLVASDAIAQFAEDAQAIMDRDVTAQ